MLICSDYFGSRSECRNGSAKIVSPIFIRHYPLNTSGIAVFHVLVLLYWFFGTLVSALRTSTTISVIKYIKSSKTCLIWITVRDRNILISFSEVHFLYQPSLYFKSLDVVLPSHLLFVPPKHAQKLKLKLKQVIEVSKSAHLG